MPRREQQRAGFSLVELLIVISLIGILAATILPSANPSIHDQLHAGAQLLSADIGYARNLAVANGSSYKLTFDLALNQYTLLHSGTNTALAKLPRSPFDAPDDPLDRQITRFASLPHTGAVVQLHAVQSLGSPPVGVNDLEFNPLGETARAAETQIWLAAGAGAAKRYLLIRVSPVTGLCWTENYRADEPIVAADAVATTTPVGTGL